MESSKAQACRYYIEITAEKQISRFTGLLVFYWAQLLLLVPIPISHHIIQSPVSRVVSILKVLFPLFLNLCCLAGTVWVELLQGSGECWLVLKSLSNGRHVRAVFPCWVKEGCSFFGLFFISSVCGAYVSTRCGHDKLPFIAKVNGRMCNVMEAPHTEEHGCMRLCRRLYLYLWQPWLSRWKEKQFVPWTSENKQQWHLK